jgi:Mrp family chromosome partitioning ATPase
MQENDLYANYDPNAPIEGFDDTVEDDSLYADTSMNYDNMVDDSDLYGNQGGMSYDDNSNMGNAEEELYNVDEDMNNGNNVGFDIDADLYGTPEQMDDAQSSVAEDPEANMYQMEEEKRARETQLRQQDMMMQQQMNNQGKKKGLLGRFKKGNAQPQQPMMVPNQLNVNAPVQNNVNPMGNIGNIGRVNATSVQTELKPFAARGNNIVVTGCGGCGTSTVAYNIANIINQLGYTVLLIDLDTEGRSQNYISRANYESMEPDGANLMAAVNSSTNFQSHVSVVKSGFHLLTMGLGTDVAPVNEMLQEDRIPRFLNMAKSASNFVIYDVPFNSAKGYLKDVVYRADNLVLVTDASNWGVTKTMLSVCNIEENDMQDIMFTKAQLVFNRYRNLSKVLGKKVRTCSDIAKVMDQKVIELLGEDPGFHFSDLHIAGIINDDPDFENGWFDDIQYSDTKRGQEVFLRLAESIVLKK